MTRPKIKLNYTPVDKMVESTGWFFLLALWVVSIYSYIYLPEIIPVHFNAAGKPDKIGSKSSIVLLLLIATVLMIGISVLNRHPHVYNYPVTITNENAERNYTSATKAIRVLKLIIMMIFFGIALSTYIIATGKIESLGTWFLPIVVAVIMLPTVYMIIQSFAKHKKSTA